jgi:AraC family transcriptional regulator
LTTDLNCSLAVPELHWRQRPARGPQESDFRATLSRWNLASPERPLEFTHEFTDGTHTITINRTVSAGRFLFGKKEFALSSVPTYSSLLVPPGEVTRIVFTQAAQAFRLYLSQTLLAECQEHIFGAPTTGDIVLSNVMFIEDGPARHLIQALLEINDEKFSANQLALESISLAIASRCVALNSRRSSTKTRISPLARWRLQRVTEYIDAHLFEQIYLTDLSNVAGITRMHFLTQFRLATGVTPNVYVLRMKIGRAQQLIRETSLSLSDISAMLGFKSQSHFTLVFKKVVGQPPARWRAGST